MYRATLQRLFPSNKRIVWKNLLRIGKKSLRLNNITCAVRRERNGLLQVSITIPRKREFMYASVAVHRFLVQKQNLILEPDGPAFLRRLSRLLFRRKRIVVTLW